MFEYGFPTELRADILFVEKYVCMSTYRNIKSGKSENSCNYVLLDGQEVSFPYRINYIEKNEDTPSDLTAIQKMIYHAIYSRSYDGFVREKHLKLLLTTEFEEWVYPYILKLCDEYIVEILEFIYDELRLRNTDRFKMFCLLNSYQFLKSYDRMISYWNEFYRNCCYKYKDYVGAKLYTECFGYSKSFEKLRSKWMDKRLLLPFGKIEIFLDGRHIKYVPIEILKDRTCADLDGRYGMQIKFCPDGKKHSISCKIINMPNSTEYSGSLVKTKI